MYLLLWNCWTPQHAAQRSAAERCGWEYRVCFVCVCVQDIPLSVCLSLSHTAGVQRPAGLGLFMVDFISRSPTLSAHTEPGLGWAALLESCRDSHTSLFIHLKTDRALAVLPFYLIPSPSLTRSLHLSGLFLHHCQDVVGVTPAL